MHQSLDPTIERNRRRKILESTNAAYAALRENPASWTELQEERSEWDETLTDGLEELRPSILNPLHDHDPMA